MSTAGLYDDLQAEDIPPQEAFPVPGDTPVEGPRQFEEPAMVPDVPGPDMQAQADEFVPPVPAEAPGNIGAPAPLPGAPPTAPLPAALDVNAPPAPIEGLSDDIAKRQKEQGIEEAKVKEANVNRQAETTQAADDDARLAYADYLERRKKAEDHYEQARQKFEGMNTLTDPREKMTGGEKFKAALYRFFSGLAGPEQTKIAMATLQKKWDDDIELQKARIGTLKDSMVMARSGLQDVDAGRAKLRAEADAFNEARYATAERQGRAQLAHLGVSKAEIDGDERIQALQAGRIKAQQQAQKDADAHALNKARIGWMEARAAKARKVGGGGGKSAKERRAEATSARAESKEERLDASDTMKEVQESLKEFKAKGGIKDSLEHASRTLKQLDADPNNPTNWVHAIDGAIRSVTGRAAIKAQFDLYMGHSHGTDDQFNAWLAKFRSGLPSPEQQKNIRGALGMTRDELARDAKDFHDNFRETYDQDARLKQNPRAWEAYNRVNQTTFGTMPGYKEGEKAAKPEGTPTPTGSEITQMKEAQAKGDHRFDEILRAHGFK